jgi:hypothetical protein
MVMEVVLMVEWTASPPRNTSRIQALPAGASNEGEDADYRGRRAGAA